MKKLNVSYPHKRKKILAYIMQCARYYYQSIAQARTENFSKFFTRVRVERCAVQFTVKTANYYGKKESQESNKEEAPLTPDLRKQVGIGGKHVLLSSKENSGFCRDFLLMLQE